MNIIGDETVSPRVSSERSFTDGDIQHGYTKINQVGGLTIRQHFAINAPAKIPEWFRHESPAQLELTNVENGIFSKHENFPEAISNATEHDIFYSVSKKKIEWERLNKQHRYFQWRTFYAENLIAELNKEK